LTSAKNKKYITKITPEIGRDLLRITVNMGVESGTFLPLIGEVQLRFGFSARQDILDPIVQEVLGGRNIKGILI